MIAEPRVLAVMLTRDRPGMTMQAVKSFAAQTYENKWLLILDTGDDSAGYFGDYDGVQHHWADKSLQRLSIGELRNEAIERGEGEIIVHWDSDDLSHPNRIEEQVALLESSGADCVGYRQLLFWREPVKTAEFTALVSPLRPPSGEAWLYTGAICGTSLLYRREAWERNPFPPVPSGEDLEFLLRVGKVKGITGMPEEPRLIARIHGQANPAYRPEAMREAAHHWTRVPDFDKYCEGVFAK